MGIHAEKPARKKYFYVPLSTYAPLETCSLYYLIIQQVPIF